MAQVDMTELWLVTGNNLENLGKYYFGLRKSPIQGQLGTSLKLSL